MAFMIACNVGHRLCTYLPSLTFTHTELWFSV